MQFLNESTSSLTEPSAQSFVVAKSGNDIPLEVMRVYSCISLFLTLLLMQQLAPDNDARKKKIRNSQKRSKNKKRKKQNSSSGVQS